MAKDRARIPEILKEIERYWKQYPELQLAQLVMALTCDRNPFYIEDEEILARLLQLNEGLISAT